MGFAEFGDFIIRNNEDTGYFEIIHVPEDTRFEITDDGAFRIPRLIADKLEADTEVVDGSSIDTVDLEDDKSIKLGTDNEWLIQYNSSETRLEFIDDSTNTSQPKFTIGDGKTPGYPEGLTVQGASVLTESDNLQVNISNDGSLVVSDAESVEFGPDFIVSDESTSDTNAALISFNSSEYVSTQTLANHEADSSAHRTDSDIINALTNALIDPSEVKTQSIFFGQLSSAPSDTDIGSGNIALYFKEDGILYKRPYGGSEARIRKVEDTDTRVDVLEDGSPLYSNVTQIDFDDRITAHDDGQGQVRITADVQDGASYSQVIESSSDVITSGDDVFLMDTSGGPVTVTLSIDDTEKGKNITVKNRTDSDSSNPVTVDTEESAVIDGNSSISLSGGSFARILCDGTNWTLL